jgi:signal transduction histidine kinase
MEKRARNLTIAQKGVLLVAVPLSVQIVFGIALLFISRRAVEAHDWELHSQQVLSRAYSLKVSLVAAQSGLRGYVLSRNPTFRAEGLEAEGQAEGEIAALLRLVTDNPAQAGRVQQMAARSRTFFTFQDDNAALITANRADEAVRQVSLGRGGMLMSAFLRPMNQFLDEEERLARERHADAFRSNQIVDRVVAGAVLLNVLVAGGLAALFAVNLNRRLSLLTENSRRLAAEQPLLPPLRGGDEIAEVDRVFHEMAASLARSTTDLQNANREMEAFAYSVSHDLRTPLRAIDGFSRILVEEYGPRLDPEAGRQLGVIRRNAAMMAQLIDDLLAFSRLSRQAAEPGPVDMRALAERTFAETVPAEAAKTIDFVVGPLPPVHGDPAMLRQALGNLLSNAVKFSARRERSRIEVGAEVVDGEPAYFVRDNGVGFDMRYAAKLFGVFQRLHPAGDFEGTGVGLAIVQRVIQRHGGRIWAESAPGEGATFHFTIPGEAGGRHA